MMLFARWYARQRATVAHRWQRIAGQIVQHEHCGWAIPYRHLLRQPLGVLGLTALAAFLCGLFVAPQGFVVFASVATVIVVGCVWPWFGIRGVSCHLSFVTTRTEEGKPVEAELIIANRWPWPVWGLAVEGGFDQACLSDEEATVAISRIGGWSKGRYRWSFTPTIRGKYPVGCPRLVTEFPFGLWKARKQVVVASSVIVWPQRFPLPPLPLHSGAQSWVGQPSESAAGSMGHRTMVREYRHGDSMRQIHWAKTALYDKLISFEREGSAVSDATITLDTSNSIHPETGPDSTLEWSIRIAASVGDALLRQGIALTLVAPKTKFRSAANGSNAAAMLDWLAVLEMSESNTDEGRSLRYSSTALTINITTDLSEASAGDSIVLVTKPRCTPTPCSNPALNGWITVSPSADIPRQIRKGWRNGPRRLRHAC